MNDAAQARKPIRRFNAKTCLHLIGPSLDNFINENKMKHERLPAFLNACHISREHVRLVLILFAVALIGKGGVLFRGAAVDDYVFSLEFTPKEFLGPILAGGRFVTAGLFFVIDSFGVNISDLYLPFGLLALFLQAVFAATVLRFVGADGIPSAPLVGALMVAHPYSAEFFTFRIVLPVYCLSLILWVAVLELISRNPSGWLTRACAFLAALTSFFTYQIGLNFFAVTIIVAWMAGQVAGFRQFPSPMDNTAIFRERAKGLAIVVALAAIAFMLLMRVTTRLNLIGVPAKRAQLITWDMIPERLQQIAASLEKIYWTAEPVMPGWVKMLMTGLLALSVLIIIKSGIYDSGRENRIRHSLLFLVGVALLIPVSVGMIIPFQGWWPVPRVLAHAALIVSLLFILADGSAGKSQHWSLRSVQALGRLVMLFAFLLMTNQIFADQQRVNEWDRMMAGRLIARLETFPNFKDVRFVYVSGGYWGYPTGIRTMQGDMNTSALYPDYAKTKVLNYSSGYHFEQPDAAGRMRAESYCEKATPWPAGDSISIDRDLAIICLKK